MGPELIESEPRSEQKTSPLDDTGENAMSKHEKIEG
jgi:hypothetical protein